MACSIFWFCVFWGTLFFTLLYLSCSLSFRLLCSCSCSSWGTTLASKYRRNCCHTLIVCSCCSTWTRTCSTMRTMSPITRTTRGVRYSDCTGRILWCVVETFVIYLHDYLTSLFKNCAFLRVFGLSLHSSRSRFYQWDPCSDTPHGVRHSDCTDRILWCVLETFVIFFTLSVDIAFLKIVYFLRVLHWIIGLSLHSSRSRFYRWDPYSNTHHGVRYSDCMDRILWCVVETWWSLIRHGWHPFSVFCVEYLGSRFTLVILSFTDEVHAIPMFTVWRCICCRWWIITYRSYVATCHNFIFAKLKLFCAHSLSVNTLKFACIARLLMHVWEAPSAHTACLFACSQRLCHVRWTR